MRLFPFLPELFEFIKTGRTLPDVCEDLSTLRGTGFKDQFHEAIMTRTAVPQGVGKIPVQHAPKCVDQVLFCVHRVARQTKSRLSRPQQNPTIHHLCR